jgi:hypothetical protein
MAISTSSTPSSPRAPTSTRRTMRWPPPPYCTLAPPFPTHPPTTNGLAARRTLVKRSIISFSPQPHHPLFAITRTPETIRAPPPPPFAVDVFNRRPCLGAQGLTPLHGAARSNQRSAAILLVEKGANVKAKSNVRAQLPLCPRHWLYHPSALPSSPPDRRLRTRTRTHHPALVTPRPLPASHITPHRPQHCQALFK